MSRRPLAIAALLILLVNVAVAARLFVTEYTNHTGSIEVAYAAISHQWMTHGIDLGGWWPLWYGGVPGQNTYPPLLHVIVALVGKVGGISAAYSHHAVSAAMYCVGALAVMWLVRALTGSARGAVTAGLLFSLTSPSAWLIPNVYNDLGSYFRPRRFQILVVYGEGPHILSLVLLPVALVLLHFALERKRPVWFVLAGIGLASVVLTNWLGAFALAAAAFAYLLAYRGPREWLVAGALAVYAYLLALPWIPPSTLKAIRTNAQWIGGDFHYDWKNIAGLILLIGACFACEYLLRRFGVSRFVRFAASFSLVVGAITLAGEWYGINVVPQPHRYHVEMEMALCLLAGGIVASLPRRASVWTVAALCVLAIPAAVNFYRYSRTLFHPIDIRQTSEYKLSRWFDANMAGKRVYAPSATQFLLNGFTDTPQFGGGFAQGIINNNFPATDFQIMSGMNAGDREGEIAIDWLRAMGVHAIGVNGPRSTDAYKSIRNWQKFEGLLHELWRDGDDVVYEVPQRSASLARVVRPDQVVAAPPIYATQTEALATYLSAIDDPALPDTSWEWISRSEARIRAKLERDQVISVQMSYHAGWRAERDGVPMPVRDDGIGQTLLEPSCEGDCTIALIYDGGTEMRVARAASIAALLAGLAWIVRERLSSRR